MLQVSGSSLKNWFPDRESLFNSFVLKLSLLFLTVSLLWRTFEHTHFFTSLPAYGTNRFWVAAVDVLVVLASSGVVWVLLAYVQYNNRHLGIFQRGIESLNDGVTFTDPHQEDNPLIWVNDGFLEMTGYEEEEVLDRNCRFLQGEDTDEEIVREISEAISNQQQITTEILNYRKDGTPFWNELTIAPIFDKNNELNRFVGIQKDITNKKNAQIELAEQRERFEQIVNNIDSVFWLSTVDKEMLYVSPTFEDIWGRSPDKIFGADDLSEFFECIHPEDRDEIREKIYNEQASGDYDEEYRIIRPDGEVRWIQDEVFPVTDEDGNVTRLAGLARDITEQKRLQQELESLLDEKNTLLQEIHHRVKNNLQVILGLLGLQSRRVNNPTAEEALEESKLRIHSMAMVHRKLYEGATLHGVDFEDYVTDLVDYIVGATHRKSEGDLEVSVEVEPANMDLGTVINCGLLINELLTNSIKYAFPEGQDGKIHVEFYTDTDLDRHLIVSDNGCGFDIDEIHESDSLGMSLIKRLAEDQLNGDLSTKKSDMMTIEVTFPPQKDSQKRQV